MILLASMGKTPAARKFFTIFCPRSPDFSGWNWTPLTFSDSMTAVYFSS